MRKVRNITVCVSPEIYRQTRHLAADYNTTVSHMVAWLLERLPAALERSRYPKGGRKSIQSDPAQAPVVSPADSPTPTPTPGKLPRKGTFFLSNTFSRL